MTKQQRRPPAKPSRSPADQTGGSERATPTATRPQPASSRPGSSSGSAGQQRRPTYNEAVAVYERGLAALQRHAYGEAASLFESVLKQFPEEKELHERVRLYLNICARQAQRRDDATPQTIQERLYASTLALNGGRYDEAIQHLRLVRDEDPDNDHALYMLAVAHAQRGEHAEAIAHLERAIALNPENRALARHDPDLEPLRDDDSFLSTLDTPSIARSPLPPRRPLRVRR